MTEGVDHTFLFGVVRDFLRLRQTLCVNRCAVVIGQEAYRVALKSQVEDVVSFLEKFGVLVVHEPNQSVLDVCASLTRHTTHFVTRNRSLLFLASETRAVVLIHDQTVSKQRNIEAPVVIGRCIEINH